MCIRTCKFARPLHRAANPCRNIRNWVEAQGPWAEFLQDERRRHLYRRGGPRSCASLQVAGHPFHAPSFTLCRTAQRNRPRADTSGLGRGRHAVRSPSHLPSSRPRPVTPGGASGFMAGLAGPFDTRAAIEAREGEGAARRVGVIASLRADRPLPARCFDRLRYPVLHGGCDEAPFQGKRRTD
jgi:hypothetical protein